MVLFDGGEITKQSEDSLELERLRKKFGVYSPEAVEVKMRLWQVPISANNDLHTETPTGEDLVHIESNNWRGRPGTEKKDLISVLQKYPEMKQEVQDFAQWILREKGFSNITLYRGGQEMTDEKQVRAWSSLTEDEALARRAFAEGISSSGVVIGIEVPVKNVFTFYNAHPGFNLHLPEKEFILNEQGVKGGRLTSLNGHKPSNSDKVALLKLIIFSCLSWSG